MIYHNPRHPYTIGLLNSVPRMDLRRGGKHLVPIEGQPPDLTWLDGGCTYRPRARRCREPRAGGPAAAGQAFDPKALDKPFVVSAGNHGLALTRHHVMPGRPG